MRLRDIATVQIGYNFKYRLENIEQPSGYAIQMKDLTDDNRLNTEDLFGVELEEIKEKYLAKENDLLFRSRGKTNTAALVNCEISSAVIAAPLFRIRVNTEKVQPGYLCWYVNHPSSQAYFATMAKGTSVQMIDKRSVEELSIQVPAMKVQKAIIDLDNISREEQFIMKELSEKRHVYMDAILMQYACNDK